MAKLVSKVYGDALFEVGLEKARLGELERGSGCKADPPSKSGI